MIGPALIFMLINLVSRQIKSPLLSDKEKIFLVLIYYFKYFYKI